MNGIYQGMFALERQVRKAGFDGKLLDLVRMRASQINGCAYCLDIHSKDARAEGELREHFSEDDLAHLTLAVVAINGWNRMNVAARTVPGDYVPGSLAKLQTVAR